MDEVRHYRDLRVWQKSMDIADKVFALTERMPGSQRFVLCSQLERAAASVPANIAEGRSRHFAKDFLYHLSVAKGSLAEVETLLLLSHRRKFINDSELNDTLRLTEETTKMLHGLKSSLKNTHIKTEHLKPESQNI